MFKSPFGKDKSAIVKQKSCSIDETFDVSMLKTRSESNASVRVSDVTLNVTEASTPSESPVDPILLLGESLAQKSLMRIQYYLQFDVKIENETAEVNWALQVSKPGMLVFTSAMKHTCWNAIKAVTIIKASVKNLLNLLLVDSRMGEYDEMFDHHEPVHESNCANIRRVCYKGVWPTTPRDFIICTSHEVLEDGSILIATTSAPDVACPQHKDYVRGTVHISGYHIQPYNADNVITLESCGKSTPLCPGECKVTLIAHTELGGSLPASIINCLSTNAPVKILSQISEIMKRTTA